MERVDLNGVRSFFRKVQIFLMRFDVLKIFFFFASSCPQEVPPVVLKQIMKLVVFNLILKYQTLL